MVDTDSLIRGIALAFIAVTLGTLLWAGLWYFRQGREWNPRKRIYKISIYTVLALHGAAILILPEPPVWSQLAGSAVLLVVLVLFWTAVAAHGDIRPKFAFDQPEAARIVTSGPYRWIRHPFYSSFMLAALGGVLISGRPELLLTIPWLACFYVRAAKEEEIFLLESPLGRQYQDYYRRTGRFFPRVSGRIAD